jgi:hypothetical protein
MEHICWCSDSTVETITLKHRRLKFVKNSLFYLGFKICVLVTCVRLSSVRAVVYHVLECVNIYVMFCWPCIILYQYSETNMMHFLFNLLRIKGFYMFRALLAHPQGALHKRHLVYCVRVMSVGSTPILVQPIDIIRTQYIKCLLCSTSWGWESNARNM